MELTILIVVLFLGVGIPLRNKRYKKWKKKREDKNGEGFISFLYRGKKGGVGSNNIQQFTQIGGYQNKWRKITQCKSSTWLE